MCVLIILCILGIKGKEMHTLLVSFVLQSSSSASSSPSFSMRVSFYIYFVSVNVCVCVCVLLILCDLGIIGKEIHSLIVSFILHSSSYASSSPSLRTWVSIYIYIVSVIVCVCVFVLLTMFVYVNH